MGWDEEVDEYSGGLLLAYEGTVSDAYFEDGRFGTQLTIEVMLDHPEDYPRIKNGIIKNWFGVGKGWIPVRNGAAVEYTGEPRKDGTLPTKFNGNTLAGRLVAQMVAIDPDGLTLKNGTTKDAAYWKGLGHCRWGAINIPKRAQQADGSFKDVEGGKDVSMPVELLSGASSNGAVDLSSLDPQSLTALTEAATTAKTHGEWIAALTRVENMVGSPAFQMATGKQGQAMFEAVQAF